MWKFHISKIVNCKAFCIKCKHKKLPPKGLAFWILANLHKHILNYCIFKFWSVNSWSAFSSFVWFPVATEQKYLHRKIWWDCFKRFRWPPRFYVSDNFLIFSCICSWSFSRGEPCHIIQVSLTPFKMLCHCLIN